MMDHKLKRPPNRGGREPFHVAGRERAGRKYTAPRRPSNKHRYFPARQATIRDQLQFLALGVDEVTTQ